DTRISIFALECSRMNSVIAGRETMKSPMRQQLTMSTVWGDETERGFKLWSRMSAGNSRKTPAYFGRKRSLQGAECCFSGMVLDSAFIAIPFYRKPRA